MTEPRTAAGRALLGDPLVMDDFIKDGKRDAAVRYVIAIENAIEAELRPAIEAEARAAALDELADRVREQYAPVYSRAAKLWLLAAIDAVREVADKP